MAKEPENPSNADEPRRRGRPRKSTSNSEPQPKGRNQLIKEARERAADSGDLPHEWLLRVARGEPIIQKKWKILHHQTGPLAGEEKSRQLIEMEIYPTFAERVDAAKAAAAFFAPKLSSQKVQQEQTNVIFSDDYSGGSK